MKVRRIYFKGERLGEKYESFLGAIASETDWNFITLIQKTGMGEERQLYVRVSELKEIIANAEAHKEV